MLEDKIFGNSGSRVVVEEFLTGPEVSVLSFTDGKTIKPWCPAWTINGHWMATRD